MNIRDIRQKEAADSYLSSGHRSVINACPRFGKIKTSIDIFNQMNIEDPIICCPRVDIEKSWKEDFIKWKWDDSKVKYSTFRSLHKLDVSGRLLVIDECQELSESQRDEVYRLAYKNKCKILGLSGSITKKTEKELFLEAGLSICYRYSIETAIEEGVICDYEIYVHTVSLDNTDKYIQGKKGNITEKARFNQYQYLMYNTDQRIMMERNALSIIKDSISKKNKTIELLKTNSEHRILVFCALTRTTEELGIPVYHSNKRDEEVFDRFCKGEKDTPHLACVDLIKAGITILPIDMCIINYTTGNPESLLQRIARVMGIEFNTIGKKAIIHIISSNEKIETQRIKTALRFFSENKIHYI